MKFKLKKYLKTAHKKLYKLYPAFTSSIEYFGLRSLKQFKPIGVNKTTVTSEQLKNAKRFSRLLLYYQIGEQKLFAGYFYNREYVFLLGVTLIFKKLAFFYYVLGLWQIFPYAYCLSLVYFLIFLFLSLFDDFI